MVYEYSENALAALLVPTNLILFVNNDTSTAQNLTPLSVLMLVWLVVPHISARRQVATRAALCEPATYSFDAEGFRIKGQSFSSTSAWSNITRVQETKSAILLYSGPQIAQVVPKRFFPTEADLTTWRSAVSAWIAPKPIAKPGLIGRWF